MWFKVLSACYGLSSSKYEECPVYRKILSKYTIEKEDGLYINTDKISDLKILTDAAEEFYNNEESPNYMWSPPYDLIIDFENNTVIIYDFYTE